LADRSIVDPAVMRRSAAVARPKHPSRDGSRGTANTLWLAALGVGPVLALSHAGTVAVLLVGSLRLDGCPPPRLDTDHYIEV
jgi:hypothetical protein